MCGATPCTWRPSAASVGSVSGETVLGSTPTAYVALPGVGRQIDLGPFRMRVLAEDGQTAGAFSVLEATEPPHFGPPMHIHEDAAEAFYVLDGEYVIFIGDDETVCPAGSFIYIPSGVRHGFRVGGVPSRKLNIYLPAAMVGYFDELAAVNSLAGGAGEAELSEIASRYAMRVLGPVPEGYL